MGGKVYIKNVSGNITVNSWPRDEIKIIVCKTARFRKDLDKASIEIQKAYKNIRIITKHNVLSKIFPFSLLSSKVSVHYELSIPERAELNVDSISGNIRADRVGDLLKIKTVKGNIEAMAAKNGAQCRSIAGDMKIGEIFGDADLETISGKITVGENQGSIIAKTVSGGVEVASLSHAKKVEIRSTSGDVDLGTEPIPGGLYELDTISGDIVVAMPANADFELQTKTLSGSIECEFEMSKTHRISHDKIQGIVGKGGPRLVVSSVSGNIQIIKRKLPDSSPE